MPPAPPPVRATPPSRRFWWYYLVGWLPFLALYIAIFILSREFTPWVAVWGALNQVAPLVPLGVGVVWVCTRFPWRGDRVWLTVATHVGFAVAFAVVSASLTFALFAWVGPSFPELESAEVKVHLGLAVWQILLGLIVYTALASVVSAYQSTIRWREEEHRAARAEALRVQADLHALRAQLNPHFLFNTLHSLMALVRSDPTGAEDAIERFGALMRYAARVHEETRDEVPLREEWSFVRNYLALESLRLGDRLRVVTAIDDEVLECFVPAFCLQPLVENAVRHAIAPRAGGGTMWIAATLRMGVIGIEVRDDGPGASLAPATANGGWGLRLVRQRLEALYGGAASFTVDASGSGGFMVRVRMPAHHDQPLTGHR